MMWRRPAPSLLMLAVATLALTVVPAPAAAGWFTDLYLGLAITTDSDVDFAPTTPRGFIPQTFKDVSYDNSIVWGGRAGYWFGGRQSRAPEFLGDWAPYVGMALDVEYFRPRIPSQVVDTDLGGRPRRLGFMDLWVTTITPELLIRYPMMKSTEYPEGRLEPYFGLGPSIFVSHLTDSAGNFGPRGDSSTDAGIGILMGPGIAFQLTDHFYALAEYRYVRATPTFKFQGGDTSLSINSHQLNIGVSYRF